MTIKALGSNPWTKAEIERDARNVAMSYATRAEYEPVNDTLKRAQAIYNFLMNGKTPK